MNWAEPSAIVETPLRDVWPQWVHGPIPAPRKSKRLQEDCNFDSSGLQSLEYRIVRQTPRKLSDEFVASSNDSWSQSEASGIGICSCWKASSSTLEESFTINKILSYLFAYPEIIRHLNRIWATQWQLHPEMRLEMPKTRRPTEGVPGFKVSADFFWKPFQSWEILYVTHIITWYHNRVWF